MPIDPNWGAATVHVPEQCEVVSRRKVGAVNRIDLLKVAA